MAQGHFSKPWEQVLGNAAKAVTEVAKSDTRVFTRTGISTRRPVVSDTSGVLTLLRRTRAREGNTQSRGVRGVSGPPRAKRLRW